MPRNGHASAGVFKPAWWLPGGHGQTLWASLTRKISLSTRSERLELPDGDFTKLDWMGEDERGPVIVVLPGLQGSLGSPYVRGLLQACAERGWRGVLLNHRGRGEPNRLPRSYHCGMTRDVEYVVHLLHRRERNATIAVVGYSLGANVCLKWLGESGRDGRELPIAAAVGVSAPFSPADVAKSIERGFARVYQRRLLRSLHGDLARKMETVDVGLGLTREKLRSLDTFYKFDDRVTSRCERFRRRGRLLREEPLRYVVGLYSRAHIDCECPERSPGAGAPNPGSRGGIRPGYRGDYQERRPYRFRIRPLAVASPILVGIKNSGISWGRTCRSHRPDGIRISEDSRAPPRFELTDGWVFHINSASGPARQPGRACRSHCRADDLSMPCRVALGGVFAHWKSTLVQGPVRATGTY